MADADFHFPDLGPCCACGGFDAVRNVVMFPLRATQPGYGWGCLECGLPSDGAVAVVCDRCFENDVEVRFACDGPPTNQQRVPMSELVEPFDHDDAKHRASSDLTPGRCAVCGCTDDAACFDGGAPCYWVTPFLCSACVGRPGSLEVLGID